MKKIIMLLLAAAFLFTIGGCAKKSEKVNIDAEKAKIQAVLEQYNKAIEIEDLTLIEQIIEHGTEIVIIGSDSNKIYKGWEELKGALIKQFQLFTDTKITVNNQIIRVHPSAKAAWFSEVADISCKINKKPFSLKGVRCTGVLVKKDDGNWAIVQSHTSIPAASIEKKPVEKKVKEKKSAKGKTAKKTIPIKGKNAVKKKAK